MNVKRIVFPTDFSHAAMAAFPFAVALARDSKAELLIVHVIEPGESFPFGDLTKCNTPEESQAYLWKKLREIVPHHASLTIQHVLLDGVSAKEIVQLASDKQADLIIMSTHGRTGMRHVMMGSVAEKVVQHARCPVLTFRPFMTSTILGNEPINGTT